MQRRPQQNPASLASVKRPKGKPPFERHRRKRAPKPALLVAYDFETTRIAVGTPRPVYLTAYGRDFEFASPLSSMQALRSILVQTFLVPEFEGAKFIAWNGNNFDVYFVAAALVRDERYVIRPYMTRSKAVRGIRVSLKEDGDSRTGRAWEFLDGIAMLGLTGVTLEKFLDTFAPDYRKLTGVIDFERGEEFDAANPRHCDYAMRDSVGLWHGMQRAQSIMLETFDEPLAVTMGGVCIKVFQAHIPEGVSVKPLDEGIERTVRQYVMRGGFCYCVRRYDGPVWKYDVNQAYAAAMREAELPAGDVFHVRGLHQSARVYIARVSAVNPDNRVPFYYRTLVDGRMTSQFSATRIYDTWLTSIEIEQLEREGWQITFAESYQWAEHFSMVEYVDRLERLRTNCEGGPKGAVGTMVKATGNHSYGKTVEQIEGLEFVMAPECPPGWSPYYGDDAEPLEHVFFRFTEDMREKAYHKPQLGAFITAFVRMQIRRAALLAPHAWLYADTDCVVFSEDVTARLDIDGARYGAWKIEEAGTHYKIIAKKVYTEIGDGPALSRSAKGLNVRRLSSSDFDRWFAGDVPVQEQIQKQNFLAVMRGAEMFRGQTRRGTRVEITNPDLQP
jgi:hypothetical protein